MMNSRLLRQVRELKKKFIFLFLCCIVLTACSVPSRIQHSPSYHKERATNLTPKKEIPNDFFPIDINIVSIGDSLTLGVGDSTNRGGYLPYLVKLLNKEKQIRNIETSNYGVRGHRSDQLLKRLNREEIQKDIINADAVIITVGGNDVMKVVREHYLHLKLKYFTEQKIEYENNLNKMITKIRSLNNDADIYLVGLYNPYSKWVATLRELDFIIEDWNMSIKKMTNSYDDVYFVEIEDLFNNSKENVLFEKDYFHPNDRGYELMAERIFLRFKEETMLNSAEAAGRR